MLRLMELALHRFSYERSDPATLDTRWCAPCNAQVEMDGFLQRVVRLRLRVAEEVTEGADGIGQGL